tara:strand:- start:27 stop:317 length:291 start_codon:yes stop_codon:yes gene_type:complete
MSTKEKEIKRAIMASDDNLAKIQIENDKLKKSRDTLNLNNGHLKDDIDKLNSSIEIYKQRAIDAEKLVRPLQDSINKLSAERGTWLKKLRRAGIKV